MMLRNALLGGLAALCIGVPAAAAPSLRPNVVVTGPTIRLGDLFSDAGASADAAVAPAPAPGGRNVYDASWLAARAHEQNLDWQPKSRYDEATVERLGQTISTDAIAAELKSALGDKLPPGTVEIALDNPALHFTIASDASPGLSVDALTFDPRSGRLSAYVAPLGDTDAERLHVTARLYRIVEIPVLNRAVAAGEPISAKDVHTIALRSEELNQEFVADSSELIGKAPKRSIRPGEPVRPSDVQAPILVHKGELVTIVLQSPTMILTAEGIANEDGALGQAIRVSNTRSKKILEAAVTSPGNVAIATPSFVAQR